MRKILIKILAYNKGDKHAESHVAQKYALQKGVKKKDILIEAWSLTPPTTRYKSWGYKMKFLSREMFYYTGYLVFRLFH